MASQNIELASFNINQSGLIRETGELKKNLNELKTKLKEVKEAEGDTEAQQATLEASIKAVNQQYSANIRVLQNTVTQNNTAINVEDKMTKALDMQANSIQDLRDQNKQLNSIRNQLDINTQAEEIATLNERISSNTELIRDNADSVTKQAMNIGNYSASIKDALGGLEVFGVKLPQVFGDAAGSVDVVGNSFGSMSGALKGATTSMFGLIKASIAFIFTPLGAIIGTLAVAFIAIKTAMSRSEESLDKLTEAFAPFMGIVDLIMDALGELGKVYIDYIVAKLELLQKVVMGVMAGIEKGLRALGFDSAADNVAGFTDKINESAQASRNLAKAEAELTQQLRDSKIASSQLKVEAENLKLIRDDDTKSLAVRLKAAQDVIAVENKMIQQQVDIAEKQYAINQMLIKSKGKTTDLLNEEADLLAKINDLRASQDSAERSGNEAIKKVQSEVNAERKANLDKQIEANKKAIDDRINGMKEALEFEKTAFGISAKTLQQQQKEAEENSKKLVSILDAELQAKKISRVKYDTEILKIQQELSKREAEISIENSRLEIDEFVRTQEEISKKAGYLTEERFSKIKNSNASILQAQKDFELERLELGVISETEYNEALKELNIEFDAQNKELNAEREQNYKDEQLAVKALEFEQKLENMRQENATEFELQSALLSENYDNELQMLNDSLANQLISQEDYNLKSLQLSQGLANAENKIEEAKNTMKMNLTKGLLSAVGAEIDKGSAVGKAIAIAQAGINMYQGISADLKLGYPLSIPAIAADTITGLSAIRKIISTKIPSATGGTVGGGGSMPSGITSSGLQMVGAGNNATTMAQLEGNGLFENANMSGAIAEGARQGIEEGMVNLTENRTIADGSTF